MHQQLYIFNPENDLALAYGGENYTAPPLATKLRNDLQMLPLWYASGDGVNIYSTQSDNQEWLNNISKLFNLKATLLTDKSLANFNGDINVWGWSADMRKRLIDRGVNVNQLPKPEYIAKLRELSHRSISITFHKRITELIGYELAPIPIEVTTLDDVIAFAMQHPSCYIKAPWSSSGRGIYRALDIDANDFKQWSSGIISRQGSVMCEIPLDNLGDFAMEFYCQDGVSRFVGYSLFQNSVHSAFDFGYLSSPQSIKLKLLELFPNKELLSKLEQVVNDVVTETIAPHYTGYVGVDMMVYSDNGIKRINPAIEINLRTTMGVITTVIGEKLIAKGSEGIYKMEYHNDSKQNTLKDYASKLTADFPLVIEDNRIKSGVLFLTPIYADANYCAYIKVLETL
ncbi:MAG: hypothetical protein R3Y22_06750 [Bacteroidales bacterium]